MLNYNPKQDEILVEYGNTGLKSEQIYKLIFERQKKVKNIDFDLLLTLTYYLYFI
jgi:hypothetical protein